MLYNCCNAAYSLSFFSGLKSFVRDINWGISDTVFVSEQHLFDKLCFSYIPNGVYLVTLLNQIYESDISLSSKCYYCLQKQKQHRALIATSPASLDRYNEDAHVDLNCHFLFLYSCSYSCMHYLANKHRFFYLDF
jgi:hypothetical protein